jgi:hypothetical protein
MKRIGPLQILVLAAVVLGTTTRPSFGQEGPAADSSAFESPRAWPQSLTDGGTRFTIYQPLIEKWDGTRILARAAVAVENAASPQPTFGAVWIVARTEIDKGNHLVTLDRFALARAAFPLARGESDSWLAFMRTRFSSEVKTIGLDRLQATLAAREAERKGARAPLKNEAPRIFFSTRPALLLLIDGEPVLRRANSGLLRVINTRALLLEDESSSRFFLAVSNRWLEAPRLDGPWTVAARAPEGAENVKHDAVAANQVDLHDRDAEIALLLAHEQAPSVFASTGPAEIVETSGEPALAPVTGTNLLWVKNANSDLFVDTNTNKQYLLISGRWFTAPSREGPWEIVAPASLPGDFARIPEAHPAGEVLASVPKTPQAEEAVYANEVPQTATIPRGEAQIETVFDGAPQLAPIEGTGLSYAVNSATPIVQAGGRFYACQNGAWYDGATPAGPWNIADSVPSDIYSIPPSCPIHYVTCVRVYDSTPDCVCVGYTPGYLGTCVSWDGCVVWGTGWCQRPWIGNSWIERPWTYGRRDRGFGDGWSRGLPRGVQQAGGRPGWGLQSPSPSALRSGFGSTPSYANALGANVYGRWQGGPSSRMPTQRVEPTQRLGARASGVSAVQRRTVSQGLRPTSIAATARPTEVRAPQRPIAQSGSRGSPWQQARASQPAPNVGFQRARAQQVQAQRPVRSQSGVRAQNVRRPSAPPTVRSSPSPRPSGPRGGTTHRGR